MLDGLKLIEEARESMRRIEAKVDAILMKIGGFENARYIRRKK